jgi:hypothetical protein
VKIEQGEQNPPKKVKREGGVTKSWKPKNEDLPEGATFNNIWRRVFIPTYMVYVASSEDPWSVNDEDAVAKMQLIWDAVYKGKITNNIRIDGVTFRLVRV